MINENDLQNNKYKNLNMFFLKQCYQIATS